MMPDMPVLTMCDLLDTRLKLQCAWRQPECGRVQSLSCCLEELKAQGY